jgi:hypoxanthine phosphoribosyltransferase
MTSETTRALRIYLDEAALQHRVRELAAAIDRDYAGRDPLLVFVMKGAFIFVADLVRAMRSDFKLDFMVVSSYGNRTESDGSVRIVADLKTDIHGRDVLIVEDIIDSGHTLREVVEHLRVRSPASIEVCTLLDKPSRRRVEVPVRYVGFAIDDLFVVGYGLDFDERYRGLPYVAVLEHSADA